MRTILSIIIFLTFFSCSKNSDINTNSDPEISFDIDSVHYESKGQATGSGYGVDGFKVPGVTGVSDTYYIFSGVTNQANSISLKVLTPNDTLKVTNYHYVFNSSSADPHIATIIIKTSNLMYNMISDGDFADITITNYQNRVVNGSFNGQVTRIVSTNPLVIKTYTVTNGLMKNVRIRYN